METSRAIEEVSGVDAATFRAEIAPAYRPVDAFDALVHVILSVRPAPPARRAALKALYDHYVFETAGDPAGHLTVRQQGMLRAMSPRLGAFIRDWLRKAIER